MDKRLLFRPSQVYVQYSPRARESCFDVSVVGLEVNINRSARWPLTNIMHGMFSSCSEFYDG